MRWPWQKIAGIGNTNAFKIELQQAKLYFNWGPVLMRLKSRIEADARFKVNDNTGCWFELQPLYFNVTNQVNNPEAEIRLAVVRDEITNVVKQYDSPGLIARLEYKAYAGTTNVNLYVHRKTGGADTYGTELFHTNGVPFSTNALKLHVSSNSLSLVYNGTTYFTTNNHGLNMSGWPDGAVCVVEVEALSNSTEYVYLDNMKACRETAAPVTSYEGIFTNAPDGMMVRSWMGDAAVYLNWSSSGDTQTYVTNRRVMLIPDAWINGSTWLNARKDFQNDLRLDVSTGGVAEIRIALRDFAQGFVKVGLLPEYLPGWLFADYESRALYLQLERNGANVDCTAYRQEKTGLAWRDDLGTTVSCPYSDDQDVTIQVSKDWIRVYYDSAMIVNTNHDLADFAAVYSHGIHPHVEFQNKTVADGFIKLDYLRCRIRDGFGTPE